MRSTCRPEGPHWVAYLTRTLYPGCAERQMVILVGALAVLARPSALVHCWAQPMV